MIKKNNTQESAKREYEIKVIRAKEVGENIAVDIEVNGVSVYGCWYREGLKDGKEWSMLSFPSHKGKDGTYYNYAWFPMSKEKTEEVAKQIEELLG